MMQSNTLKLLWTYSDKDPEFGHLKWYGSFSGVRPIHLLSPLWKKPNFGHTSNGRDVRPWDVTVKNVSKIYNLIKQFFFLIIFSCRCPFYHFISFS